MESHNLKQLCSNLVAPKTKDRRRKFRQISSRQQAFRHPCFHFKLNTNSSRSPKHLPCTFDVHCEALVSFTPSSAHILIIPERMTPRYLGVCFPRMKVHHKRHCSNFVNVHPYRTLGHCLTRKVRHAAGNPSCFPLATMNTKYLNLFP